MKVTELRKGTIFQEKGNPWKVLQYTHTKMVRGGANIKVKARNLISGKILESNSPDYFPSLLYAFDQNPQANS